MKKKLLSYIIYTALAISINTVLANDFKFALITDIHISQTTSAYQDLTNSINQINSKKGIDFAIISGDITENGDTESLTKAKNRLDSLFVKYYAISGNHETKWSKSAATAFAKIYGSENFKFEHEGILFLGFNTGPIIRMMDGHIAPQDIIWLKKELDNAKPNQPIIIITHYPLTATDVDNWYDGTDLLRNYNIKAIIGGHYHVNKLTDYDGIPAFICRSNLRAKEAVGGYSTFEVTKDSIKVYENKIGEAPRFWGGYSLSKKYFGKDNSSYARPDYSVNEQYPGVKEIWTYKTQYAVYAGPSAENNKIFVGDDSGLLHCLDAKTGNPSWSFQSGNRILGTPLAKDGVVVFGSADNSIYGLRSDNGKLIWKIETSDPIMGAPAIENGIACIGGSDTKFRAIDIKTGKIIWTYEGIEGYIEAKPLLYNNLVIFGAWDTNLYALDQKTGNLIWKWNNGHPRLHFSPAAVWPVGAQGKIFVTAPDRYMTAIDANTGKTVWRTNQSMVRETIGLSEDGLRVYSKTMQDSVVCYSTQGTTPQRLWATNVAYGYDHAASMPLEKDGTVFGSTKNGIIFAIEGKTGKLLWKHKVGNSVINTIIPIDKHSCIFTSGEGIVGKLKGK